MPSMSKSRVQRADITGGLIIPSIGSDQCERFTSRVGASVARAKKSAPCVPDSGVRSVQVITGLKGRSWALRFTESGLLLPSRCQQESRRFVLRFRKPTAYGGPSRFATSSSHQMENQQPRLIPNTLFQIPVRTHELNSGSTSPWFGQKKFVTSRSLVGVSRFRATKSARYVRV